MGNLKLEVGEVDNIAPKLPKKPMSLRVVGLLLFGFSAWQACAQTPNNYFTANSSAATADLLRAVESHHLSQGTQKLSAKQFQAAWGDFDFILRYFPNHPRALVLMGELCERWQGPACQVESYFEQAIRMSPDADGTHLTRGVYLQKRGKIDEAIESYKRALELNPDSANTHYNLGLAYVAQKKFELANQHAQEAYSRGITLPGLQQKLLTAKAWKPLPPKPTPEPAETPPSESAIPAPPVTPAAVTPGKPGGGKETPDQGMQGEAR